MTATWEERALASDGIAAQYDRVRSPYPPQLYDDLIRATRLDESTPILEIGCGPGTFTLPLAERGYAVDAVELGPGMARHASGKLAPFERVRVIQSGFEAFSTSKTYRLIVAASAFHWLDVMTRFQHCAQLLEADGFLAICSAGCRRGPASEAFWTLAEPIYRTFVAAGQGWHGASRSKRPGRYRIGASRLFDAVSHGVYHWQRTYRSSDYVDFLDTWPEHRALPPDRRLELYGRLTELLDSRFHGEIVQHFEGNLDLRRRKAGV